MQRTHDLLIRTHSNNVMTTDHQHMCSFTKAHDAIHESSRRCTQRFDNNGTKTLSTTIWHTPTTTPDPTTVLSKTLLLHHQHQQYNVNAKTHTTKSHQFILQQVVYPPTERTTQAHQPTTKFHIVPIPTEAGILAFPHHLTQYNTCVGHQV